MDTLEGPAAAEPYLMLYFMSKRIDQCRFTSCSARPQMMGNFGRFCDLIVVRRNCFQRTFDMQMFRIKLLIFTRICLTQHSMSS